MNLYQLYLTTPDFIYRDNATDYIVTADQVRVVLASEDFLNEYDYYFEQGITGFKTDKPDNNGNIKVIVQFLDFLDDYEETVLTLVPVKNYL